LFIHKTDFNNPEMHQVMKNYWAKCRVAEPAWGAAQYDEMEMMAKIMITM
jgi:hypothetical protein